MKGEKRTKFLLHFLIVAIHFFIIFKEATWFLLSLFFMSKPRTAF